MAKKEVKTLDKKQFNLSAYKAANKLDDGIKDKAIEWIPLSSAFQKVTGLQGIPKGYVAILRGFSNTGKSTALLETAIGCQKIGTLPVIIDTENGWNWGHAREVGFEFEEVIDPATGEIIDYEGNFIFINNEHLIKKYGGKVRTDEALIEDVASFINELLTDQKEGKLPYDIAFLWDSVGTLDCLKSYESKSSNNQWNAGAIEQCFKSILNYKIPGSRKENKDFTNTFIVVNKIWLDAMQGAGVIKNKGGEAFQYASRIVIHFGGIQSYGTKKLFAKADGLDYQYGTQTKIAVEKNHVTGTAYKGDLISTAHGFILNVPSEIEKYKKENKKFILDKLGINDDAELTFSEEETLTVD